MKIAIFQLLDNSTILVKTLKNFDVKCSNTHFSFLQKNKDFCNVGDLLDNNYFQKYANLSIYPFLGAKILQQNVVDGRLAKVRNIPYFSLNKLICKL